MLNLPNPLMPLALPFHDLREINRVASPFAANSAGAEMSSTGVEALKSFAMLVGRGEGPPPAKIERKSPFPAPEARYAYYRRCQQFRRNGQQCKAPAMKGEQICHRHAEQADMKRRRAEQRREILSKPGAGLGSFRAIQRTIGELAGAILAGSIDRKAAGRLMVDIQTAIRVQRILTAEARRRGELLLKPVLGKVATQQESVECGHEDQPSREIGGGSVALEKRVVDAPSPVTSLHSRGRLCHTTSGPVKLGRCRKTRTGRELLDRFHSWSSSNTGAESPRIREGLLFFHHFFTLKREEDCFKAEARKARDGNRRPRFP
jgi:hypothetical protein